MAPKKTSYPKQDIKVLLLEGISPNAVETFRAAGYSNIVTHAKSLPEDELRKAIADAHFIGIRSRTHLSAEVLSDAKRLLAIGLSADEIWCAIEAPGPWTLSITEA